MNKSFRRIGIFDSGLGGLTVLKPLLHYYPAEYIYLADTANLPYGTKSSDHIRKLTIRIVDFLIDQKIDACIIACHTICAVALPYLRRAFAPVPFFGMIDLTTQQALSTTKINKIGVIATTASIMRHAHKKQLLQLSSSCIIIEQACPRIVPAIEFHYDNKILLHSILQEDLGLMRSAGIDTLILGSTHYPLVSHEIQQVMGPTVTLISADHLVAKDFAKSEMKQSSVQLFVTGDPDQFAHKTKQILNWPVTDVTQINLNPMTRVKYLVKMAE